MALVTIVPKSIIEELNEIQKTFLWSNKKCKIKHGTLCNDYKNEGLKKIVLLKCPWICRLCNECHHDWKIIPLTLQELGGRGGGVVDSTPLPPTPTLFYIAFELLFR